MVRQGQLISLLFYYKKQKMRKMVRQAQLILLLFYYQKKQKTLPKMFFEGG